MLDSLTANSLKDTITSAGWQEVLKPQLEAERTAANEVLVRSMEERPEPKHSDDFLRGYIRGLGFALSRPFLLVKEFERNIVNEMDRAGDMAREQQAVGSPYGQVEPEETP